MAPEFIVGTDRQGSATVVSCCGELDIATRARLEEALAIALEEGPRRFVFDGTGISLLSSQGITVLLDLARTCRRRGIALELKLGGHARRVLDIVGLWWLGVVDGGLCCEDALEDAVRAHAPIGSSADDRPAHSGRRRQQE